MRIKVLGCSGGVGPDLRTTSLLIDDSVLIDAGTGVGDLSLQQMRQIGEVFLTHSHLDHVCGLAFMADNLFDLIERPIQVHATGATLKALRDHIFNWVIWPDFGVLPSADAPLIEFREFAPGTTQACGEYQFHSFEVHHTVPAVGYAVQAPTGVFAFSGDTAVSDSLWDALNALPRLDQLMIEVAFPDQQAELGERSRHYTPAVLARELQRLRHRPGILLTHHKPGCEALIEQQCRTALADWRYRHLRRGDILTI